MARTVHVDDLWQEAQAGTRKLTAAERRRVLVYLDELGGERQNGKPLTKVQLAKIFQVSEKTIHEDYKRILRSIGMELTPEAQVEILARHMRDLEQLITVGKNGLVANEAGTINERFYLETLVKLYKERRESYENAGIIRKELGTLNVAEENWVATADVATNTLGVHKATDEELESTDPPA